MEPICELAERLRSSLIHQFVLVQSGLSIKKKSVVLRASRQLQTRFEDLLERGKCGELTKAEEQELQAIDQLDAALSWLNRLAHRPRKD